MGVARLLHLYQNSLALVIRGLAAGPLRLRRARLERVGYATAACPLRNMSYYSNNVFYK